MVKCYRCKNLKIKRVDTSLYVQCKENVTDLKAVEDIENFEIECDKFNSKYIEYPLVINELELDKDPAVIDGLGCKIGDLVKVRPCAEVYQNKTFLGVYLGDMDIGLNASYNPDTKVLKIYRHHNPAIFVPEIKKIIYGCGSWWGRIKDEEELRDITDNDIDSVWYMKLLKSMSVEPKNV